ncbi:hypothetical protein ACFSQE_07595 [Vogesella fluminis]|uniref:EamA domain-containing protein n=1 Tax=Vogesella fluminis TaxID=1069161 RepID=A0ABQ3HCB2_9NEIS|nr:hypothetical protein [Vogesella fluminis]GHD81828.1 hypothetical protein GCM10011419_28440 [Vogesella fluminis]
MLTEILGVLEKTNTRPLLIALSTLSFMVRSTDGAILADPFSWDLVALPILGLVAYATVFAWIYMIHRMNLRLSENDIASWGPIVGGSLLAFCLLVAASYFSKNPQGLSFTVLAQPNFIYFCTLTLLAAETTKIRR